MKLLLCACAFLALVCALVLNLAQPTHSRAAVQITATPPAQEITPWATMTPAATPTVTPGATTISITPAPPIITDPAPTMLVPLLPGGNKPPPPMAQSGNVLYFPFAPK